MKIKLWRKLYRATALLFPLLYLVVARRTLLLLITSILFLFLILEIVRFSLPKFNETLFKKLHFLLKEKERNNVSASTLFVLGAFLTVALFQRDIAILALSFSIIGDMFAEIIGTRYNNVKMFNKSLEGNLACFASSSIIGLLLLPYLTMSLPVMLIGAFAATGIQALPIHVDDNLTIALFSAFIMSLF